MNNVVYLLALCLTVLYKEIQAVTDCNGQVVPNVCPQVVSGITRLPHPTDSHQFLMCSPGGRMYVVRCPDGETYDNDKQDCAAQQILVPTTPDPYNPCTAARVSASQLYFPYPGDRSRYIQCLGVGSPSVLTCPLGQTYEPQRRTQGCVAPFSAITTGRPTAVIATTARAKPCDLRYLSPSNLYFPYPGDSTKFIQCDFAGDAYVMQCPEGLTWSQPARSCVESVIENHKN